MDKHFIRVERCIVGLRFHSLFALAGEREHVQWPVSSCEYPMLGFPAGMACVWAIFGVLGVAPS